MQAGHGAAFTIEHIDATVGVDPTVVSHLP
jgi:hypothetical protein